MAIFVIKDLASGTLKVVRAESEANARDLGAGKGKERDERYLSQDHYGCDVLEPSGADKVLLEIPGGAEKAKA